MIISQLIKAKLKMKVKIKKVSYSSQLKEVKAHSNRHNFVIINMIVKSSESFVLNFCFLRNL